MKTIDTNLRSRVVYGLWFCAAAVVTLMINGAVPFVTIPTHAQAIWASGFAQSFANAGGLSVYAHDFGLPVKAPITFGAPGVLIQSILIQATGMHPLDSFTTAFALFFILALWGASRAAADLGLSRGPALAMATVWVSSPAVWMHTGFSYLAVGFALLPLYFHVALWVLRSADGGWRKLIVAGLVFLLVATVSVFMDGYTYVMAAVGWMVLIAGSFLRRKPGAMASVVAGSVAIVIGVAGSYLLYKSYAKLSFGLSSMDMFRAFGLDVMTLVRPWQGHFWLWDLIGLSTPRTVGAALTVFGDASVLYFSSSLLVILVGLAGFIAARKGAFRWSFLILALTGFYFSLGPSLKVGLYRTEAEMAAADLQGGLSKERAPIPTGSELLSSKLPGLNQMRASYRWMGLGLFGFWGGSVLLVGALGRGRGIRGTAAAYGLAGLLFLPNIPQRPVNRFLVLSSTLEKLKGIEPEFIQPLKASLGNAKKAIFAPSGNDFLANYVAAVGGIKLFNAGGDKNMAHALSKWPKPLTLLRAKTISGAEPRYPEVFSENIRKSLRAGIVDAVILTNVDLLWSVHGWPQPEETTVKMREINAKTVDEFKPLRGYSVKEHPLFTIITLSPEGRRNVARERAARAGASRGAQAKPPAPSAGPR